MRKLFFLPISLTTILFAGCSIHPIPDDIPGISTVDIAHSIYCETHHALKNQVIIAFENSADPRAKSIGAELKEGTAQPWEDRVNKATHYLDEKYQLRLGFFKGTDVGFAFRFKITENDVLTSSAGFKLPFTTTTFTLGVDASTDKKRQNERRFRIEDNFRNILFSDRCSDRGKKRKNFLYPINGSIGINNIVHTFIKLLIENIKLAPSDSFGHFSELLQYTTTISGGVNPSVSLGPVAKDFRLTSASLGFEASRTDFHEVKIVFRLKKGLKQKMLAIAAKRAKSSRRPPDIPVSREISRQLDNLNTLQNDQRIIDALGN